jgi:hypothetical protein
VKKAKYRGYVKGYPKAFQPNWLVLAFKEAINSHSVSAYAVPSWNTLPDPFTWLTDFFFLGLK